MAFSSRISSVCLVLGFALLLSFTAEARDHLVGGKPDAWNIPSSQADSLNNWAEKNRFKIGDSLVWKYDSKKDSVLQVTREAYLSCNISSPIAEHKEGETKVALEKAGPYYFISGSEANCQKGEKLIVVVMADRSGRSSGGVRSAGSPAFAPAFAPAPMSGVEGEGPTVAPAPASGCAGLKGGVLVAVVGVLGGFLMM